MNFSAKGSKKCLVSWKSTKNHRFGQNLQLFEQTTMFWHFDELFRKKMQKVARFVKKHEHSSIWPKLATSRRNYHVLAFRWLLQEKVAKRWKKWLISWNMTKNHRFGENFQLFEQITMSWHFHELFSKKLQKAPHSVEKHEKSSIWPKLCNFFEQTTMSLHFDQLFGKKLQKVPHFVKQHEKSLIWPKLCNFWNKLQCLFPFDELSRKKLQKVRRLVKKHQKSSIFSTCNFPRKLPCFDVSMNIAAKSCKKLLVPWKSTKNHQFGQIFATFRTNFHVFAFRWIFKEKVAKSSSFREKARKIIDLAKTLQLFEQTTMFWHFDEVFSKKLQKVPHFVKKHEKSSIWRKLATFPTSYHVLTLWWTFQRKVAESASFSEKTLKIIDWAKTCNFFEQSNMFMHFDELFSKRKQKVPRFVKKHEKSSIWPKLATFRTNYHVLAFRWTFQEKNAKSGPFREKARTLIDLAKTCNFSKKLPCFGISMIIAGKSCKKVEKVAHFVKHDEKSSIWRKLSTFRANYHVLAFSWTFQQEVAKSSSFRGKAREIIDLAKTMQLFRTNYHVFAFRSTFREKVAKSASFRETARKIIDLAKALQLLEQATMSFSFWWTFKKKVAKSASSREKAPKIIDFLNLQLSEKTTMFWRFDEHCSKKLQKAARAVKKHEKSSIWPNLCNFSNKLPCFCISMNFQGKGCQKFFVSWKSTKNHRFGQNFATFRANYHVLAFRWSFQQKVTKSASFR